MLIQAPVTMPTIYKSGSWSQDMYSYSPSTASNRPTSTHKMQLSKTRAALAHGHTHKASKNKSCFRTRSFNSGVEAAERGLLIAPSSPNRYSPRSDDSGFTSPNSEYSHSSRYSREKRARSNSAHQDDSLSGYGNPYPRPGLSSASSQSRASSVASLNSSSDGEIDYKKLYEEKKYENGELMKRIETLEVDMASLTITKDTNIKNSGLSDRERRTLQRRVAELEEDCKKIDQLRADNQRLKEENGALIRVISKLSK